MNTRVATPRVSPTSPTTVAQAAAHLDQRPNFMCKPQGRKRDPDHSRIAGVQTADLKGSGLTERNPTRAVECRDSACGC